MKNAVRISLFLLFVLGGTSLMAKDIELTVKGMQCAFCAQGIEAQFKKENSVKAVNVDLDKNSVKLVLNDGAELSDQKIAKIIKDAGYELEKIAR